MSLKLLEAYTTGDGLDSGITGRFLEHHPKMVANHVRCELPAAHRPTDERADEVLGILEHETVAGIDGYRRKRRERVGALRRAVTRYRSGLPIACKEQLLNTLAHILIERKGNVSLCNTRSGV